MVVAAKKVAQHPLKGGRPQATPSPVRLEDEVVGVERTELLLGEQHAVVTAEVDQHALCRLGHVERAEGTEGRPCEV